MKFKIVCLIFFLLSSLCKIRAEYIPTDIVLYNKFMEKVNEIEIYSNFLASEKSSIKNIDEKYYKIRWEYLLNVASPQTALQVFINACKTNGYLSANDTSFSSAALILGYELNRIYF